MDAIETNLAKPVALLVDDDRMMRLLIRKLVEFEGYEVVEAESGEECLEIFPTRSFDIILLDALMPGIDGFDTCRQLHKLAGNSLAPVLMITGLDSQEVLEQAQQVGALDVVSKPLNREVLKQKLRKYRKVNNG